MSMVPQRAGRGDPRYSQYDMTNLDNLEQDYELGWENKIEKIYELPGVDDMPAVFLRGNFKDGKELNAHLRLFYRHRKYGDRGHQELLRAKIGGGAAIRGRSRVEALFAAVNLIASDMFRAVIGLPKAGKNEGGDQVQRGSDFRPGGSADAGLAGQS